LTRTVPAAPPVTNVCGSVDVMVRLLVEPDDESDVPVVWIENRFEYVAESPSGLVTTTSQVPADMDAGITKVHDISVGELTTTFVPGIFENPDFERFTVAPASKLLPTSCVMDTVVPAYPESGRISRIDGLRPVAAVVTVVETALVVATVTGTVVATAVGIPIVTVEGSTFATLFV